MYYIDVLMQDCSNPIANALELLQSCTKPYIYQPNIYIYLGWFDNVLLPYAIDVVLTLSNLQFNY